MKIEMNPIPENKVNKDFQLLSKTKEPISEVKSPLEFRKNKAQASSLSLNEMRQTIDKATGLIQTIVTDKLSEEVIRKMPADEYLKMLTLLDEMINGSIDSEI